MPFSVVARYTGGAGWPIPATRARVRKIAAFRDWVLAQAAADPLIARYAAMPPLETPAASPLARSQT
ncbi:hypothetical protein ACRAWD_23665 [Caulobacter segnis]